MPTQIPQFSPAEIARLARLDYPALANEIISPFVGDS
ncbi:MAG: hypothetical protein ACK5R4_06985 [Alphaproteobacteria bacterium]